MRITPDMPREPGTSVEFSGALIDDADIIGLDNVGIKATTELPYTEPGMHIRLVVDSFSFPNQAIWMNPDDAEALADILRERASEARRYND